MPFYEIHHIHRLTDSQQDKLAELITKTHSEVFTTPRIFVNVRFYDDAHQNHYVAGKRRKCNMIIANVRAGPGRTQDMYDGLLSTLNAGWRSIVGSHGEEELRAIFLYGSIVGGSEAGVSIPPAGQDVPWLREHIGHFKKLAAGGDPDFVDLLEDLKSRPALAGIVNGN